MKKYALSIVILCSGAHFMHAMEKGLFECKGKLTRAPNSNNLFKDISQKENFPNDGRKKTVFDIMLEFTKLSSSELPGIIILNNQKRKSLRNIASLNSVRTPEASPQPTIDDLSKFRSNHFTPRKKTKKALFIGAFVFYVTCCVQKAIR